MVQEKVTVSTRTLQWKCVESRADSKHFYYRRFDLNRKFQENEKGGIHISKNHSYYFESIKLIN